MLFFWIALGLVLIILVLWIAFIWQYGNEAINENEVETGTPFEHDGEDITPPPLPISYNVTKNKIAGLPEYLM